MSSLKESEEQTSPPATPLSLGVHVANSHFSKISASRGNKGCLKEREGWGGGGGVSSDCNTSVLLKLRFRIIIFRELL